MRGEAGREHPHASLFPRLHPHLCPGGVRLRVTAAHTCAPSSSACSPKGLSAPAPAQSGRAENGLFLSQIPKESKLCKICGRASCFSYPRRASAPPTHSWASPLPFFHLPGLRMFSWGLGSKFKRTHTLSSERNIIGMHMLQNEILCDIW